MDVFRKLVARFCGKAVAAWYGEPVQTFSTQPLVHDVAVDFSPPSYESHEQGAIQWRFEPAPLHGTRCSASRTIAGVTWHLEATTRDATLIVALVADDASTYRHCRAELRRFGDDDSFLTRRYDGCTGEAWLVPQKSPIVEVEARWTFTLRPRHVNFELKSALSDVTLIVEEERRMYVSKAILAFHSPFFYQLFYGDFSDSKKDEIVLKDVQFEELQELLHVLYPSKKEITHRNVEVLLKLADMLDVPSVRSECAELLIRNFKGVTDSSLLDYADTYHLAALRRFAISELAAYERTFCADVERGNYERHAVETRRMIAEYAESIRGKRNRMKRNKQLSNCGSYKSER